MDERAANIKLGTFVLVAIALLLAMMFFFGLSTMFEKRVTVYTLFRESVQGLSVGSDVKYRGVQVGRVKEISIDITDGDIIVVMEIEQKHFFSGRGSGSSFDELWNNAIGDGLRSRLGNVGITGMKYVELDYFERGVPMVMDEEHNNRGDRYIASVPSMIKSLTDTLGDVVTCLKEVNLPQLSERIASSVDHVSSTLSGERMEKMLSDLGKMVSNLEELSSSLNQSLSKENVGTIVEDAKELLDRANALVAGISKTIADIDIERRAEDVEEIRLELRKTMETMNGALESIGNLADSLADDPQALIRGKNSR